MAAPDLSSCLLGIVAWFEPKGGNGEPVYDGLKQPEPPVPQNHGKAGEASAQAIAVVI